jgi:hypothetical protein
MAVNRTVGFLLHPAHSRRVTSAEFLRLCEFNLPWPLITLITLFGDGERGQDGGFRLQFEAVSAMSAEEKALAKSMLDAIILKNQVAGAVHQLTPTPAEKWEEAHQYETKGAAAR